MHPRERCAGLSLCVIDAVGVDAQCPHHGPVWLKVEPIESREGRVG